MTSIDFLNKVHKSLDSQEYSQVQEFHAVLQWQIHRRPVR